MKHPLSHFRFNFLAVTLWVLILSGCNQEEVTPDFFMKLYGDLNPGDPIDIQPFGGDYLILSNTIDRRTGIPAIRLMRIDDEGLIVDSLTYGRADSATATGLLISGTHAIIAGNKGSSLLLAKFDAALALDWEKTYTDSTGTLTPKDIIQTRDGGYVTIGNYAGTAGLGSQNAYFQKTDATGELIWTRKLGTSGIDNGVGVYEQASGDILYCVLRDTASSNIMFSELTADGELSPVFRNYYSETHDIVEKMIPYWNGLLLIGTKVSGTDSTMHLWRMDFNGEAIDTTAFPGELASIGASAWVDETSRTITLIGTEVIDENSRKLTMTQIADNNSTVWSSALGTTGGETGKGICATNDKGYLSIGTSTVQQVKMIWVSKVDNSGN